jgi:hypothetical protein
MNRNLLLSCALLAVAAAATWKGCRYDWNPHYASNKAVVMDSHLRYNPDSSAAVVGYTLDVGARGTRYYTALLRKEDYQGDLSTFMLPAEYVEPVWRGNDTLEVSYDEGEAFRRGGNVTNVAKERDLVKLNGIVIKVKERRLNKQEALHEFMRSNNF